MKKKGFTLIELLAVIVILAIIALIAVPIISNIIENARKGAAERSAENYVDAVEIAIANERLDGKVLKGEYSIDANGKICKGSLCTTIDMNGNKSSSGMVVISNGEVTYGEMLIGEYWAIYDGTKVEASKREVEVLCTTAEASESNMYNNGVKYSCDLGESTMEFYVLNANSNTNTVSLISVDQIGTNTITVGDSYEEEYDRLIEKLLRGNTLVQYEWTKLLKSQISLPNVDMVNLAASMNPSNWTISSAWLQVSGNYDGYVLDQYSSKGISIVGNLAEGSKIVTSSDIGKERIEIYIRPVITISKDALSVN